MTAATKGYTAYTDYAAGGALLRVESGSGFSHKSDDFKSYTQESLDNLNAKQITVTARTGNIEATQTDFLSREKNGNRIQNSSVTLNAKKDIILKAGESLATLKGRQQSAGVEAGAGFAMGAQTGWYVYAQAGFTNGKQEETHRTYQNSRIDTETFNINAGGNATLDGATARAKTINADIKGDLKIISRQDEHLVKNSSTGASLRVQGGFGTAWGASGNVNAASGNSLERQVNEQSGFFAEDGGYHINANNIHLKGGAIASTNPENSELSTNKLTFEDIQNESKSRAVTAGISGSANLTNAVGNAPQNNEQGKVQDKAQGDFAKLTGTPQNNGVSTGLPMFDQSQDNTITKATLTEGKITLNKDTNPTLVTAKSLGIHTAVEGANPQVEKPKDVKQQLKEQQILINTANNLTSAVSAYSKRRADKAKAEADEAGKALERAKRQNASEAEIQAKQQRYDEAKLTQQAWEDGGSAKRKMDTAVAVVNSILAGKPTEASIVAVISPELNAKIHQLTKDSKTANLLAHATLSALESYVTGNNPLAGAAAGVIGEGAAMLTSKVLGKTPEELTADEREFIKTVSQFAGAVAAGTVGDSTASTVAGMETAKRAVENNLLSKEDDELVYKLSEKLEKKGYLTKDEQMLLAERLLRDSYTDKLLLQYQKNPNDLPDNLKATLVSEIHRIARTYNISSESLFNLDLTKVIKRDDTKVVNYLNQNNNFQNQFSYSSKDGWESLPIFGMGAATAGKIAQVSPKIIGTMEKYPLLTEIGVTAVADTAYQLANKDSYDPHSLLKAEMSTVFTRNKKLWQQMYMNSGLNILTTDNSKDYGWTILGANIETGINYNVGKLKLSPALKQIVPLFSGYTSNYYGDVDNLKRQYQQLGYGYEK